MRSARLPPEANSITQHQLIGDVFKIVHPHHVRVVQASTELGLEGEAVVE